jgi:DNA polymerase III alpha subunit (gram-positive type)
MDKRPQKIVFFDLETSGTNHKRNQIIQIAAIAVQGPHFEQIGEFERKLQFDMDRADPEALEINHYSPEAWAGALSQRDGLAAFNSWVKKFATVPRKAKKSGRTFYTVRMAGHNIIRFDMNFLREWYGTDFCPADYMCLDTQQLAQWMDLECKWDNYKLGNLCIIYGIDLENAHDALSDVKGNVSLARRMLGRETVPETQTEGE